MAAKTNTRNRRRRRKAVGFFLLLFAVLCVAAFYCVSVFCEVVEVTVSGDTRYPAADIIEAAAIPEEQNLFTVSQKRLQQNITALCPYVEKVTLRRHLPETLEIVITEYSTVFASIGHQGRITMLNGSGCVLEQRASLSDYSCLLLGEDFSGEAVGTCLSEEFTPVFSALGNILTALEKADMMKEVGYIDISDPMDFKVMLQDRLQLRLGTDYDLDTKLQTARKVMNDGLAEDYIGYLDVSVAGRAYAKELPITEAVDAQYLAIIGVSH